MPPGYAYICRLTKLSSQVLNMDDHLPVFVLNGYENLTLFKVVNAVLLISHFWINNITLAELFCFFCFLEQVTSLLSRTWMILSWTTLALSIQVK